MGSGKVIGERIIKKLKDQYIRLTPESRLYNLQAPIIGLTGGIATGKSSSAKILKAKGFSLIDADQLVKSIYQSSEALEFVKENFPEAVKDNSIHFPSLREKAFATDKNQKMIEDFIYARMPDAFLGKLKELGGPSLVIYDVPLLFEKGLDKFVDLHICIHIPRNVQIERLIERDGIERELAEKILEKQIPIDEKAKLADFSIANTESLTILEKNIESFLEKVLCQS